VAAFRSFRARWRREYGSVVRRLERDLPELLSFFAFPRHLWRKLRTTNVIEPCFVEVRRRTRPMVCFVNVERVDRIIYSASSRDLIWNGKPAPSTCTQLRRAVYTLLEKLHPPSANLRIAAYQIGLAWQDAACRALKTFGVKHPVDRRYVGRLPRGEKKLDAVEAPPFDLADQRFESLIHARRPGQRVDTIFHLGWLRRDPK
jgi:hypothetical protein